MSSTSNKNLRLSAFSGFGYNSIVFGLLRHQSGGKFKTMTRCLMVITTANFQWSQTTVYSGFYFNSFKLIFSILIRQPSRAVNSCEYYQMGG